MQLEIPVMLIVVKMYVCCSVAGTVVQELDDKDSILQTF